MKKKKKENKNRLSMLIEWLQRRTISECFVFVITSILLYRFIYWIVFMPLLCLHGEMTTAYTYEWCGVNAIHYNIKYYYTVDGVDYKGRTGGHADYVEVCYLPSHPRIHLLGYNVDRARHKYHIVPKTQTEENAVGEKKKELE